MTDSQKAELAKQYLSQARNVRKRIEVIEERKAELEARAKSVNSKAFDNTGIGHRSGHISKTEEYTVKIESLVEQLVREHFALLTIEQKIHEQIEAMPREKERMLLEMRYINGQSYEEISIVMDWTYRHTTRVHGIALRNFFDLYLNDEVEIQDSPF